MNVVNEVRESESNQTTKHSSLRSVLPQALEKSSIMSAHSTATETSREKSAHSQKHLPSKYDSKTLKKFLYGSAGNHD